ncbi:glutamate racemase [Thermocrinis sp.]
MKIGIFDSGVGGLTVLKALREELPSVDFFYLGDTARVPYGSKSKETIQRYSLECADFLLSFGIELLVVACNTASAYALDLLRESLAIPVVGVVEPGVEYALKISKGKRIGVIGTKGTVQSAVYQNLLRERGAQPIAKACPLFVPLVEEGIVKGRIAQSVVEYYLEELKDKVDTLILACTHYPLLKETIKEFMGDVDVVDSAHAVAQKVKELARNEGNGTLKLFFTDNSPNLSHLIKLILGQEQSYETIPILCKL